MRKHVEIGIVTIIITSIALGAWSLTQTLQKDRLVISTTTSLYETGLLDLLDSKFEAKHSDLSVTFISQGTGLAIQTAMHGDADMIVVHDLAREKKFLEDGCGVNRKIIAYNYYVIVGPEKDPASVKGMSPVDAMLKIKASGEEGKAIWISRGDDSGTHSKEKSLWKTGGQDAKELRYLLWYLEAGSGMTATLKLADEKRAYTLCDMGSYLNNYASRNIDLKIVVEAGKDTLNVYSAIACDPRNASLSHVKFGYAMQFIEFLVSDEMQEILSEFGVERFGQALFKPAVRLLKENTDPTTASWIKEFAYIDRTECPAEKRYESGGLSFLHTPIIAPIVRREMQT